jgi:transposase
MLDQSTRTAILKLHQQGHSSRGTARALQVSRGAVRDVLRSGAESVPALVREEKATPYRDQIVELYERCKGNLVRVHEELLVSGAQFSYSALTAFCRRQGIGQKPKNPGGEYHFSLGQEMQHCVRDTHSHATASISAAKEWLAEISYGWRAVTVKLFTTEFKDPIELNNLLGIVRNGTLPERKKAATILARKRGIPNTMTAIVLHASPKTTRRYFKVYTEAGAAGLFSGRPRVRQPAKDAEKTNRILELLHCRPDSIGFNRMNWTQDDLIQAYEARHHETISRGTLARLIKKAGYGWRKARRVLTSPDPNYQEKMELLVTTLRSLKASEVFLFIDEWGPVQVRKRPGRAYRDKYSVPRIPRHQVSRGTVSLVAALSATTNQTTWMFVASKDTRSIVDLLEILYNQYHGASKLYVTWDAVAWHNSTVLTEWLDDFNEENKRETAGPVIELVPLPTSAQFLNVIEGVLNGMSRAVIHNSDYKCTEDMKLAISRHFNQRNQHFQDHPKRAGSKIWEMDALQELDVLRAGV